MNLVKKIPIGDKFPDIINCIIEIPKGTSAKYEYNEQYNTFQLARCLYSSMIYTASYGFIPQTHALDNDPLDIIVYNNIPIQTGALVEVRPIAALDMTDNGDKDFKVVAVPVSHVKEYHTLKDLESHWVSTTLNFFSHYKDLEDKVVEVGGWLSKARTKKIILEAHSRYNAKTDKQLL